MNDPGFFVSDDMVNIDYTIEEHDMHETDYPDAFEVTNMEGEVVYLYNPGPPIPSEIVMYQNDERGGFGYAVPAMVSVTLENLVPEAVERNLLSGLDSAWHAHLVVFGPGSVYFEQNVPYDPEGGPRTWHRR